MNANDTVGVLWLVKAHWPNFEIFGRDQLQLQVGAWMDVLGDLDLADARAALAALSSAGREFPPSAGQVRVEALRIRDGVHAPDVDKALAEVHLAVRRIGHVGTPEWSHPAITAAVEALGGWQEVCMSENPEALRAHFVRVYDTAAARSNREAATPPLLQQLASGLAERLALDPPAGGAT